MTWHLSRITAARKACCWTYLAHDFLSLRLWFRDRGAHSNSCSREGGSGEELRKRANLRSSEEQRLRYRYHIRRSPFLLGSEKGFGRQEVPGGNYVVRVSAVTKQYYTFHNRVQAENERCKCLCAVIWYGHGPGTRMPWKACRRKGGSRTSPTLKSKQCQCPCVLERLTT
jgi:hypothetical protein